MTDTLPLAPLRVGVTLDGPTQPRWIARILESIAAAPECELTFVSFASDQPSTRSLLSRVASAPRQALFECFRAADDRVFARPDDALSPRDVRSIVGEVPRAPAPEAVIDVVLRLGRSAINPSLAARARHGVWTLRFGARSLTDPDAIGLYEVLAAQGTAVSELCVESPENKRGRVLARAVTRADVRSVRRGRGVFFAKSAALVLRALRDVYDGRSSDGERSHFTQPEVDLPSRPDNGEMLRLLAEHGFRYAQERLDRALYVSQWVLAWQRSERFPSEEPFRYLLPPKDRFWADPFASVRDGRRRIFFEECPYATGKGHISLVELDERGDVSEVERVLEEGHHLSYPFLLRHRGEDFMLPEGSERGGVGVYRAKSFPRGWELVDVMLSDRFVSDVTLREIDGRWWLFADVAVDGTRTPSEEFHIFHGPTPFGPWTPHRRNPISSDAGRARPAGALFSHDGKLYRPAQDCATRYGYAVTFNEIVRITPDEYEEVDRGRMIPSWDPRLLATHTLNRDGDLTVIDAVMRRPR